MFRSRKWGLRLLVAVLCFACLVCSVRPLGAAATEEKKQQTLTTLVHNRAYYSSSVIGQMENGTQITVLGQTREFYKVDCYDMKGYIAKTQVVHNEDGTYYIDCKVGSSETCAMDYADHADALTLRHALFDLAKEQLGSRYVYGGTRPGAFDCSGLMYYLYGQYGIQLHRNASAQMQDGIIVAREGLQVGDLIFFREYGEYTLCSHVGIYVGNNQIIHSGDEGVVFADLDVEYFAKYYLCARRIVNTGTAGTEAETPATSPIAALATVGRRG